MPQVGALSAHIWPSNDNKSTIRLNHDAIVRHDFSSAHSALEYRMYGLHEANSAAIIESRSAPSRQCTEVCQSYKSVDFSDNFGQILNNRIVGGQYLHDV